MMSKNTRRRQRQSAPDSDILDTTALQQLLTTQEFGRTVYILPSTTSTNDIVKDLAQHGAPEGTAVVAEHQTQGRGRHGRSFVSPAGVGIYVSLLLRPQADTQRLPQLTLAVAVATAEALAEYSALPIRLKWPNDVEISGKKVAGILCEAVLHPVASPLVIIGIGINVNTVLEQFPPELHQHVTSLALAAGHTWARLPLLALLLAHLERLYRAFQQGNSTPIRQRWLHYGGQMIGRQVRFAPEPSAGVGTVVDLDENGALLVQNADGTQHRLVAGEVLFL
jgi:BirA family transcriptional regulator, biotin operon repressor / biotin---[acetyl-CoA-carboxylase] ligase